MQPSIILRLLARSPRFNAMTPDEAMRRIDALLSHVWMVRAFLKHSDEAAEDDELREIHRQLYDFQLAIGEAWKLRDAAAYLKMAQKKFSKLRAACADFVRIQPEVSSHTNFQMAAQSLQIAVDEIGEVLASQSAHDGELP